jgi:hypothetical protein
VLELGAAKIGLELFTFDPKMPVPDHVYVVAPFTFKLTVPLEQTDNAVALTVNTGVGFTEIVVVLIELTQPVSVFVPTTV